MATWQMWPERYGAGVTLYGPDRSACGSCQTALFCGVFRLSHLVRCQGCQGHPPSLLKAQSSWLVGQIRLLRADVLSVAACAGGRDSSSVRVSSRSLMELQLWLHHAAFPLWASEWQQLLMIARMLVRTLRQVCPVGAAIGQSA